MFEILLTVDGNQNEVVFEAGEPLTDEEFNSDVQGKAGKTRYKIAVLRSRQLTMFDLVSLDKHGAQPWQIQPHSGLLGGDGLPGDENNANKNAGVKWPKAQVPYVISKSFCMY